MKEKRQYYIPTVCLALFVLLVASAFYYRLCTEAGQEIDRQIEARHEAERLAPYKAWCKLTGNEKELTYAEWKVLKDNHLLANPEQQGQGMSAIGIYGVKQLPGMP